MVLASLLYAALTNSKTAAAAKKKAEAYANATGPLPKLCRDCTTSIHMGCHAAKHGFFHRIFNCLMPMIALLPAVEENDQACLYGMGGGGGVLDFVRPILSDVISTSHSWRTIMCSRCSGDAGMCSHRSNFSGVPRQFAMESGWNYTSLSSGNFMATSGNATEGPQALLRRYLGRRAWPFFTDPRMERRAVVLIVRKGGGRVFAPGVEQQLLQALQQATGREVYVYRGNESTAQTVDVFANARAVVGYHGAGFANTMMSTHGACVMEASTNANVYGTVPWRTNAFMCLPWNPGLRWAIYRVPLTHMLDANHVRYPNGTNWTPPNPDQFIKALALVPLRPAEVHAMAAATQSCLGPLERGLPWPLLERANESQRVVLPGMEDTGIAYLDRVDLHTLRHAAARHGAANRQPSIDEQLHWNSRRR